MPSQLEYYVPSRFPRWTGVLDLQIMSVALRARSAWNLIAAEEKAWRTLAYADDDLVRRIFSADIKITVGVFFG